MSEPRFTATLTPKTYRRWRVTVSETGEPAPKYGTLLGTSTSGWAFSERGARRKASAIMSRLHHAAAHCEQDPVIITAARKSVPGMDGRFIAVLTPDYHYTWDVLIIERSDELDEYRAMRDQAKELHERYATMTADVATSRRAALRMASRMLYRVRARAARLDQAPITVTA